ncbi:MAG: InlB B-repeat-containing protein, partial [Parabacteroides gordonii]|uniref:InlB B-repeat-containing protein n=1 Tax=Parabacteroides gordonii TaxID=574930 RepID=UPI003A84BB2B
MKRQNVFVVWLVWLIGMMSPVVGYAVEVSNESGLKNAIANGGYIKLTANIDLGGTITISKDVELDLNGKTIKYAKTFQSITVFSISNGSVTIENGTIHSETGTKEAVGIDLLGGKLIIKSGEIYAKATTGHAISARVKGGTLSMEGGALQSTATTGYTETLKIENGTISLKSGTISGSDWTSGSKAIVSNLSLDKILVQGYGAYKGNLLQSMTDTNVNGTVEIKPITYNFNCDLNGGTITSGTQPSPTYTVESPDITLPTLSKRHYEFLGWRYDLSDVERVEPTVTIKQGTSFRDRSFTAQFKPVDYPIVYERNGGQKESNNPDTYTVETVFTFERPIKPFYKFEGWFDNGNFSGSQITELNKDFYGNPLRLYAKWSPEPYEVDFYDGDTKYQIYDNYTRDIEKGISVLPKPEKQDRVFTGWKQKDGTLVESVSPGTESMNLYASWKLIEFTIQYDPQGGQMDRPSIQYTSDKIGGLTWLAGESVWKEGYAFKGWFPNTEYNEDERITTFPIDKKMGTTSSTDESKVTIRLYAKWEEANYDILFLPRGGSAVHSEEYSLEKGVKESEMPETERRGWKFLGWFDQPEGGNKYTSIAAQPGPDKKKITLYAHWKAYDYKLAYVTNGGTLPADAKKTYTVAEVVTLPEPKKEHYDFVGWFTANEGGTKYMENVFYYETGDKTLYAR